MKKLNDKLKRANKKKWVKQEVKFKYPDSFKKFCLKWFEIVLNTKYFQDYELRRVSFMSSDEMNPYGVGPSAMSVDPCEAYLEFDIEVFPAAYKSYLKYGPRLFVERYVIHELAHTITATLTEMASERCITWEKLGEENEKMTERYARLLRDKYNQEGLFDELGKDHYEKIQDKDNE